MGAPICRPLPRHVDLIGRCFITIQGRPRCNTANPNLECPGQSLEELLSARLQSREKRIAEVEGKLLAARAEIEELRNKVLQLEERNARLRLYEAHVLETGRRIS
jgi:hypothetical protein